MRGFCTDAYLVFIKYENYQSQNHEQRICYARAVENFITYLKEIGIVPKCFITDEVAQLVAPSGVTWVSPLSRGDAYFVKSNCDGMGNIDLSKAEYLDELIRESEKKHQIEKGISIEKRFEKILKRDSFVTSKCINEAPLVVAFCKKNKCNYKVNLQEGKQQIRIFMDSAYMLEAYLAGNKMNTEILLDRKNTRYPVHQWKGWSVL